MRMYDCPFYELIASDTDTVMGCSIEEKVQLVLTDPKFNHRRESGRSIPSHDVLTPQQLKRASEVIGELLGEGGHGAVFHSPIQFTE